MDFSQRYCYFAAQIIVQYKGEIPFHLALKHFFSANKKFGARDRKAIAHLCYCYYRTCNALNNYTIEEKIVIGLFLCATNENKLLSSLNSTWGKFASDSIEDKLQQFEINFDIKNIFPFSHHISNAVNFQSFAFSHLRQPDLFIRIRPNKTEKVLQQLKEKEILFQLITPNCIALSNATKLENTIALNSDAVIQDWASQQIAGWLPAGRKMWDCCAGSGGKSILAVDTIPDLQLYVSDNRSTILYNLKKRFGQAVITNYQCLQVDLSQPVDSSLYFDTILCDVPCSGSGTWGRTPEELCFFSEDKLACYCETQKKIVTNILTALNRNGYLLYITCSVFKQENEDVTQFISETFPEIKLLKQSYVKGFLQKADTMFVALLQKITD